jgi:hypothetical protein
MPALFFGHPATFSHRVVTFTQWPCRTDCRWRSVLVESDGAAAFARRKNFRPTAIEFAVLSSHPSEHC